MLLASYRIAKPDLPHLAGLARHRGQQIERGQRPGGGFVGRVSQRQQLADLVDDVARQQP
jgi:hypothetical protein